MNSASSAQIESVTENHVLEQSLWTQEFDLPSKIWNKQTRTARVLIFFLVIDRISK